MRLASRLYCCLFGVFAIAVSAAAQPALLTSVYVSETDGNDVPPCGAIKKPCKTFAFSMTRVAAKGRVIVLNTGEYGAVQITKSVTIEAPPGVNALIQTTMTTPPAGPFGIEIAAGADDNVTLRGLKVMSPGARGILFSSAAALYVENCVVHGGQENIDISPFGFTGDVRVYIRDSVISGFSSSAIAFTDAGIRVLRNTAASVRVQIERTSMEGNGYGLLVGDGASATARGCVMVRNRFMGVGVGGATGTFPPRPTAVTLEGDVISGNQAGIGSLNTNVIVRVSNCTITDNDVGIDAFVPVLSRGNNTLEANTIDGTFTGLYTAK